MMHRHFCIFVLLSLLAPAEAIDFKKWWDKIFAKSKSQCHKQTNCQDCADAGAKESDGCTWCAKSMVEGKVRRKLCFPTKEVEKTKATCYNDGFIKMDDKSGKRICTDEAPVAKGNWTGANKMIEGCTDIMGSNYNFRATVDDGSCIYSEDSRIVNRTDLNSWNSEKRKLAKKQCVCDASGRFYGRFCGNDLPPPGDQPCDQVDKCCQIYRYCMLHGPRKHAECRCAKLRKQCLVDAALDDASTLGFCGMANSAGEALEGETGGRMCKLEKVGEVKHDEICNATANCLGKASGCKPTGACDCGANFMGYDCNRCAKDLYPPGICNLSSLQCGKQYCSGNGGCSDEALPVSSSWRTPKHSGAAPATTIKCKCDGMYYGDRCQHNGWSIWGSMVGFVAVFSICGFGYFNHKKHSDDITSGMDMGTGGQAFDSFLTKLKSCFGGGGGYNLVPTSGEESAREERSSARRESRSNGRSNDPSLMDTLFPPSGRNSGRSARSGHDNLQDFNDPFDLDDPVGNGNPEIQSGRRQRPDNNQQNAGVTKVFQKIFDSIGGKKPEEGGAQGEDEEDTSPVRTEDFDLPTDEWLQDPSTPDALRPAPANNAREGGTDPLSGSSVQDPNPDLVPLGDATFEDTIAPTPAAQQPNQDDDPFSGL